MSKRVAVLGTGWLGLPLAQSLKKKGYVVGGTASSSENLMSLFKSGIAIRIIKVLKNNIEGNWSGFTKGVETLIIAIPPGGLENKTGDFDLQIKQICKRSENKDFNVIFISSTSVYGYDTELITENTEPNPIKELGAVTLEAEQILKKQFGEKLTIVRFAGLFGEERHPGRFFTSNKTLENPNGKINLIHLDDCIQLITAILDRDIYGEVFNGCADEHPTRAEFYKKAAESINISPPDFAPVDEFEYDKVISNKKSKDLLNISYSYPNPEMFFRN